MTPTPPVEPALDDGVVRRERPLGILDLVFAFGELRRQNERVLASVSDRFGVTMTDLRALSFIHREREATPKLLAEYLGLTTGALTSLVDRLERASLVRRQPHPTDRRSVIVQSTPLGAAAALEAIEVYEDAFAAGIEREELETVHRAFVGIGDSLRRLADSRGVASGPTG